MQKRVGFFLKLITVVIWLGLIFFLYYRHYVAGVEISAVQKLSGADFTKREEWFGIYSNSGKMGFMRLRVEKIGTEYRFSGDEERDIGIDGKKTVRVKTEFSFLADPFYRVKTFEAASEAAGYRTKARGEIKDNQLVAFLEANGKQQAIRKNLESEPYSLFTLGPALFEMGLGRGKKFNLPVINLLSFNIYNEKVTVEELVPIKIGNEVRTAFLLRVGRNLLWISDTGFTLKEEYPSGTRYYAEPEEIAKGKAAGVFDYLSLPVITTNKHIAEPEKMSYARFRISGGDKFNALDGGSQTLKGNVLEVRREMEEDVKKKTYKLPYKGNPDPAIQDYLKNSLHVQSDFPELMQTSNAYARLKDWDAWEYSQYIALRLFRQIRKQPIPSVPDASEVFRQKAGECNEHTVLFTAYARAAGLPARMVGGLTYVNGRFYFHTWPEIWIGSWLPVDPTRGQVMADAMHIRLIEGDMDKLSAFGDLLKNVKIDILEAR